MNEQRPLTRQEWRLLVVGAVALGLLIGLMIVVAVLTVALVAHLVEVLAA